MIAKPFGNRPRRRLDWLAALPRAPPLHRPCRAPVDFLWTVESSRASVGGGAALPGRASGARGIGM